MASLPFPTSGKKAAFTHLLALFAGVVIGKSIDADKLEAYRSSSNDGALARIRRRSKSFLVSVIVLGLIVKTFRMAIGDGGGGGDAGNHDVGRSDAR
ncbi:hypothetical protein ACHAW5_011243 [Stephanodiscus triporus]|uniref:Uncharacterized protein n=1 Tax=Stephanodiscus triporus TaxID=2934178 RepID=A0ABD3PNR8_9STRA